MQANPTQNPTALQTLFDAGGHFVLAKADKRPLWRSWDRLRPPLDLVQAHDGPLGLKPWSVGTTGLDVDHGDPSLLLEDHPAMAVLASRRPGGRHLYYHDTKGRGNGSFSVLGCSGEIRSAKGYLILWGDGPEILADALSDPIARSRRAPVDLFELAGLGAVTLPAPGLFVSKDPNNAETRRTWARAAEGVQLEHVRRGARNSRLFDAVRFWAYSVNKGLDLHGYMRRVRVHAMACNRRLPEPLSADEVQGLALSVSTWCWSGGGARWHFDHSSATQRRRGIKSGKVRRARVAGRDRAILEAYAAGASMRSIAREWGIPRQLVQHVIKRGGANEPNQSLLLDGQELGQ